MIIVHTKDKQVIGIWNIMSADPPVRRVCLFFISQLWMQGKHLTRNLKTKCNCTLLLMYTSHILRYLEQYLQQL